MENEITPSVGVLVFKKEDSGQVHLVRNGEDSQHLTGKYGLPSGRVDPGETEEECAVKELKEETGLETILANLSDFPDNTFYAKIPRKTGEIVNFRWHVFLCRDYEGEIRGTAETVPSWHQITELSSLDLLPNIENAVKAGLQYLAHPS